MSSYALVGGNHPIPIIRISPISLSQTITFNMIDSPSGGLAIQALCSLNPGIIPAFTASKIQFQSGLHEPILPHIGLTQDLANQIWAQLGQRNATVNLATKIVTVL